MLEQVICMGFRNSLSGTVSLFVSDCLAKNLPEQNPELSQENLKAAQAQKAKGGKVVLVRIGRLSPPRSRLQNVRLESITF
jgi:hypothetical protein